MVFTLLPAKQSNVRFGLNSAKFECVFFVAHFFIFFRKVMIFKYDPVDFCFLLSIECVAGTVRAYTLANGLNEKKGKKIIINNA